jgi:hypothetical protein
MRKTMSEVLRGRVRSATGRTVTFAVAIDAEIAKAAEREIADGPEFLDWLHERVVFVEGDSHAEGH